MWQQLRQSGIIRPLILRPRDYLRSARSCGFAARREWTALKRSRKYLSAFDDPEPLVSICIHTYNRGALLVERSVRSALNQTYQNIEIVVVGDCCTDDTAERMSGIKDPRLKFINLPQRGVYPEQPMFRWMVAGTTPANHAMRLARGAFVTHLDDDDEHPPQRVATLLETIRATRADLIWHPFEYQAQDYSWNTNQALVFGWTHVTTSSIFYHAEWKNVEWDIEAWRLGEPGDWNRFRRMRFLGLKAIRHPGILLRHYRERSQSAVGQ